MTDLRPIFDRLSLGQYLERFIDEGFDSWETVLDITESDLDALGVKLGHRRRLQREIANVTGIDIYSNAAAAPKTSPQQELQLDSSGNTDRVLPSTRDGVRREIRDDLKAENLSFTDVAKRVGEKWQTLSPEEREPFEAKAASAKEAYLSKLALYKQTDQYKEHAEYLADFKARHSSDADGKKPRLEPQPGAGRNDSVESQTDSPEPRQGSSVPRRLDQASHKAALDPRHRSSRSRSEARSNTLSHSPPKSRYSPTTSVSSMALSGHTEKSTSPSVPPTPRQMPFPVASMERDPTKRPDQLPAIISLETRDAPVTRGSSLWFDNHLSSTLNKTSPLSNYRRSFHPPASFVHQGSNSSSKSISQSSDVSETSIFSNAPREDLSPYRQPPIPSSGLEVLKSSAETDGLKPRGPMPPMTQAPPHHAPSLSSLSLKVGTTSPHQGPDSSVRGPAEFHPNKYRSQQTCSNGGEKNGIELRGKLGWDADPLSVLVFAGKLVEGRSPELD